MLFCFYILSPMYTKIELLYLQNNKTRIINERKETLVGSTNPSLRSRHNRVFKSYISLSFLKLFNSPYTNIAKSFYFTNTKYIKIHNKVNQYTSLLQRIFCKIVSNIKTTVSNYKWFVDHLNIKLTKTYLF